MVSQVLRSTREWKTGTKRWNFKAPATSASVRRPFQERGDRVEWENRRMREREEEKEEEEERRRKKKKKIEERRKKKEEEEEKSSTICFPRFYEDNGIRRKICWKLRDRQDLEPVIPNSTSAVVVGFTIGTYVLQESCLDYASLG
ncbi:hypothetical protein M0804_011752 [Polistes exclamans]|nr:hypothetical protein M0804_011752 [Polistes exclamans]